MGYLICEKCGGYYELQPGEKPEDFLDKCDCGGNLSFADNLDSTDNNLKEVAISSICPECGMKNPENSIFCQECGGELSSNVEKQKRSGINMCPNKDCKFTNPLDEGVKCPECGTQSKIIYSSVVDGVIQVKKENMRKKLIP